MNMLMYRLTTIHRRLDEEIGRELARRLPDPIRLLRLKALMLTVKGRLRSAFPRPRRL